VTGSLEVHCGGVKELDLGIVASRIISDFLGDWQADEAAQRFVRGNPWRGEIGRNVTRASRRHSMRRSSAPHGTRPISSYAGYPYTPSSLLPTMVSRIWAAPCLRPATRSASSILAPFRPCAGSSTGAGGPDAPLAARLLGGGGPPDAEALAELQRVSAQLEAHQDWEQGVIGTELVEEVRRFQPAFVVFKLWNGRGFTGRWPWRRDCMRSSGPAAVSGGPQASCLENTSTAGRRSSRPSRMATGERSITELAEHATGRRALADIAGIFYRTGRACGRTNEARGSTSTTCRLRSTIPRSTPPWPGKRRSR